MLALLLAVTMQPSLTFEFLQNEAERDPSALERLEDSKSASDQSFDKKPSAVQAPQSTKPDSYHFEGKTPVKGVSIYTPVKDQRGDEGTEREEGKDPLAKIGKFQVISGVAAGAGLIGGFFFPPLWILGGAGLGVFGVLTFLKSKFGKKK
jgi:hypothetical protein